MNLDGGKSLEAVLGGAVAVNELDIVVSYSQFNIYGAGSNEVTTNGSTPVEILDSPPQGDRPTMRVVNFISVKNTDTVQAKITIQINNGTATRKIYSAILDPEDALLYEKNRGWYVLDKYGANKIDLITANSDEMIYIPLSGGPSAYTGTSPKLTSYYEGLQVQVKIPINNVGNVTWDLGYGAKHAVNFAGVELSDDELETGGIYQATYDGTKWQIISTTDKIQNDV